MKKWFPGTLFLLFISFSSLLAQNKVVTFNVNTATIDQGIESIEIRGHVAPLSWITTTAMGDEDGDGIYSVTVDFGNTDSETVYYKYVLNGVFWEDADALNVTFSDDVIITQDEFRYVIRPENPFKKFFGEWDLKNDLFAFTDGSYPVREWKTPGHYSMAKAINTDNSLLQIIDSKTSQGHILWVYNQETREVSHVSSFLPFRAGTGSGTVNENGDVHLKISFQGEPAGSYRRYSYVWLTQDEYIMKSTQYNEQDEATGNFYGGTFTRKPPE